MITMLFGSTENLLLIILSLVFRAVRAAHDGLVDRGFFYRELRGEVRFGDQVGSGPLLLLNMLGRDLFVLILYLHLWNSCPVLTLSVAVALNFIVHDFLYWICKYNRSMFNFGDEWFQNMPSLFKRKFMPKRNSNPIARAHSLQKD